MGATVKDDYYHGHIKFQRRDYWIDEVHDTNSFIGKWCIGVQVPGVIHNPQIFTISVRYYDVQRPGNTEDHYNNETPWKRPALFESEFECKRFMSQLYFPDRHLRIYQITPELCRHKVFMEYGAYMVKESAIIT